MKTAKVSIRNARRDGIDALKKAVKDGLAEDEQKNAEAKLQKVHDKYIAKIEEMLAERTKKLWPYNWNTSTATIHICV